MSTVTACARFLVICLILIGFSGDSVAQVGPKNGDSWAPERPAPPPLDQNPLTVEDLVIDKTDKNSVVARDAAIADAPALAFRKLAERNMEADELKSLKVPGNVSSLVQNFEIKDEQMSATRYVAKFTVRFTDAVRNYIDVRDEGPAPGTVEMTMGALKEGDFSTPEPAEKVDEDREGDEDGAVDGDAGKSRDGAAWQPGGEGLKGVVLVLPYFENLSAQTLLWEDPNPWRRAWQDAVLPAGGETQFVVPLGDISDIAAGPANAVWSGDYKAIEKLRAKYGADAVVLPVANRSGSSMTIDVYSFRNGKLRQDGSITPYAEDLGEAEAFDKALKDTLRYLQKPSRRAAPPRTTENISREVVGGGEFPTTVVDGSSGRRPNVLKPQIDWNDGYRPQAAPQPAPRAAPAHGGRISAAAFFPNFRGWVEMQRRLRSIGPGVAVDVESINNNRARITLSYPGSFDALRGALAERGIAIAHQGGGEFVLSLSN